VANVTAASCSICGRRAPSREIFARNGFPIRRCDACGVGMAVVEDFDPEKYYTSDYFKGHHTDGYNDYPATERILRREFAQTLAALRSLGPTGGKLLEIGCAYGFFLDEARRFYDVYGVEISRDAVASCHARGMTNVVAGTLDKGWLEANGPFDVVVMLDVIEHLQRPDRAVQQAAEHLRPGGLMVATTGDFGSVYARHAGPRWRLMTPPQHLWFFTVEALSRLGERFGLRIIDVRHPWKLVPISLAVYQIARIAGRRTPPKVPKWLGSMGLPMNLFDALRITWRKEI
jgi:SAM-dependent methyltransferase